MFSYFVKRSVLCFVLELSILAIDGFAVMSEKLVLVYISLLNRQVPSLWANAAYSPKPLSSWVNDLIYSCA